MATLSDVAALAGVSVSAVSRVLTNDHRARVSADTRKRIQEAAAKLDYHPNFAARALKSARTRVLGLAVPDVTNAIFAELTEGVEDEAGKRGYMMLIARSEGTTVASLPRLIGEGRVDGMLVQARDGSPSDMSVLGDGQFPVVFINSIHPDHVGSVTLDDALGVRIAVEHLVELGHRRIGFVGGVESSDSSRRRERGYREAMSHSGLVVDEAYVTRLGYGPRDGGASLAALAELVVRPTAVVVANVNAALGALLEARRLGIRVPQDLSIVAFHDAWTATTTWPPLTAVRMPLAELGRQAVRDLIERIESGVVSDHVVTSPLPILVERESTASPPVG